MSHLTHSIRKQSTVTPRGRVRLQRALLALFATFVFWSVPALAAQKSEPSNAKVDSSSNSNHKQSKSESHSDRTPARVEGDLSPEAKETLEDAGQKVQRMLDRSTRGY